MALVFGAYNTIILHLMEQKYWNFVFKLEQNSYVISESIAENGRRENRWKEKEKMLLCVWNTGMTKRLPHKTEKGTQSGTEWKDEEQISARNLDIEDCWSLVGVWGGDRRVMEISRGKGKDIQEKVLGEDIMGLIDWEDLGIIDTRTSRSTAVRTTTRLGQWVLRGRQELPETVTKNAESGETGTA